MSDAGFLFQIVDFFLYTLRYEGWSGEGRGSQAQLPEPLSLNTDKVSLEECHQSGACPTLSD